MAQMSTLINLLKVAGKIKDDFRTENSFTLRFASD